MMFNIFGRGGSIKDIDNSSYAGLTFYNECHELMVEAEKPKPGKK